MQASTRLCLAFFEFFTVLENKRLFQIDPVPQSNCIPFMSLRLKLLDIDHPLTFEESKLRQIETHALIYLSMTEHLSQLNALVLITEPP